MDTKTLIILILLLLSIFIGGSMAYNDDFCDLWEAGNFAGKFITVILAIILLPGIIAYFVFSFLEDVPLWIEDFLFPRMSGYQMKIKYDEKTYEALRGKKIYCKVSGPIYNPNTIVFLCKADWKKALKHFPELESKAQNSDEVKKILEMLDKEKSCRERILL